MVLLSLIPALVLSISTQGSPGHDVAQKTYDPVSHALSSGIGPERYDAAMDAAAMSAKNCPMVFDTSKPIPGCWQPDLGDVTMQGDNG